MLLYLARTQSYQLARLQYRHINRSLNFGASLVHLDDPNLERLPRYNDVLVEVETVSLQNWLNLLKPHCSSVIWDLSDVLNTTFVYYFE